MTRRVRKNFQRPRLGHEEAESAADPETAAEEQSWLGPYPVTKALPTFENLTFRKLRGLVQADQPPMTQKGLDECIKIRREVRRRIQQAPKAKKKKVRRLLVRKKRREQHERNTLRRRERGLLSHTVLRRFVGQKEDADSIWLLTEKILGFSEHKEQTARLASKMENNPCTKSDEEDGWEDSDDEEQNEDKGGNCGDGFVNTIEAEHREFEEMEYDDASGEVTAIPRRWGKWFNSIRQDDQRNDFSEESSGILSG